MSGFSVKYRNPGHWDIYADGSRSFCIRGEPGRVLVRDERDDPSRPFPRKSFEFKTVSTALMFCADELMIEGE